MEFHPQMISGSEFWGSPSWGSALILSLSSLNFWGLVLRDTKLLLQLGSNPLVKFGLSWCGEGEICSGDLEKLRETSLEGIFEAAAGASGVGDAPGIPGRSRVGPPKKCRLMGDCLGLE